MPRPRRSMMTVRCLAACWGAMLVVAAIALAADPPKGLVLHLSFDEPDAQGQAADASGLKTPVKIDGPKWSSTGKKGGGVEFHAATDRLTVAPGASLELKQLTLAAWFKTSRADATWRRIFDQGLSSGYGLGIGGEGKAVNANARGKLAFTVDGKGICVSDATVVDGLWHHVAATFDGEALKLYVDGVPQKSVVATRGPIPSQGDTPVTIGQKPSEGPVGSFEGSLDEVMIFNRALGADEIKAMVAAVDPAAGKPKFTKNQVLGRLRQLKQLHDEGLLTDEFYQAKVAECEAAMP